MKPKVVKHLTDMEIDEISLVDRGANQHATVAIAKRAPEEERMPELYTEDGTLLDENSLEDGQIVYDEAGNAYKFELDEPGEDEEAEVEAEEADTDDTEDEDEEVEDRELAGVGKAFGFAGGSTQGPSKPFQSTNASPFRVGAGLNTQQQQKKKPLGAMGGGAMPQRPKLGGAVARPTVAKSFQEQVLEELSKAYTDEDRDAVLSKAFAEVDAYKTQAAEAVGIAKAERDLRLTNEYIAKAAEYNVPVDAASLGPVLYRMAETMSYEDCTVIHKCLEAAGEAIFEEVGYIGGGDNVDVLDQVEAQAKELIGKSADTSSEDAWEQLLNQNPAAYDEYLAQSRRGY